MIKTWAGCLLAACVMSGTLFGQTLPALNNSSVSVPFPEFAALLNQQKAQAVTAPVDYVFSPAKVAITADRKKATITSDVTASLLNEKWMLIPVGPAAGVLTVTANGTAAPVVAQGGVLFALLDGSKNKTVALQIVREEPVGTDGADALLKLPLVPAPLADVTMTIAAANQDVDALGGAAVKVSADNDKTILTGNFSGETGASISWRDKPAAGVVVAPRVLSTTLTRVAVDRGIISYQVELDYEITRAGVNTFKVALPEGVEFDKAAGTDVQSAEVSGEGKDRVLTVKLNTAVKGSYKLTLSYEKSFEDKENPTVSLVTPLDLAGSRGFVGVEVRGGYDVTPTVNGAERIDVKELPAAIWTAAASPLLFGYRYEKPGATMTLALVKHDEVAVLMAMCDICEAATTVTPDGKTITKLMYVMRNNLKQSMVVKLPPGAQLWSAFVDDQPVTPSKNGAGDILVPLKKSEAVDPDDDQSYKAKRDARRRGENLQDRAKQARTAQAQDAEATDLKPYDVEIVYVTPAKALGEKGDLSLALPQVDVPVGNMAWAVLLPEGLRVVDSQGTMSEVGSFALPFVHFAEAGRGAKDAAQKELASAEAQAALNQLSAEQMAASSKAAGVLPVRIEMPLTGDLYRFEKLLVVDEPLGVVITYRKKAE